MLAVLLIHSSSVSERRMPMSSRHVGSVGHVGCGVRIRMNGPHWKRGMAGGGGGSRVHSINGSTWIRLHQTLPSVRFCFSIRLALLKRNRAPIPMCRLWTSLASVRYRFSEAALNMVAASNYMDLV